MSSHRKDIFDIVILSSEKDFNKLKYVYESIVCNVVDVFDDVYVITDKPYCLNNDVIHYLDDDVLEIDRSAIGYRPGWIAQQYLKLFQGVSKHDCYLVVDADVIFNRPISIFEHGRPSFFGGRDQHHLPYFEYTKRMLNLGRVYPYSFINEFMLFDRRIIADILSGFNNDKFEFIRRSNEIINSRCYLSEYELYGNYVCEHYRGRYNYKRVRTRLNGKRGLWSDRAIEDKIAVFADSDYDVFTIHSWL